MKIALITPRRHGKTTAALDALARENAELRAQNHALQTYNNEQVEFRRKAEDAMANAIREMSAYARICGELEAKLCAQMEHPGRNALLLAVEALRHAKLKYPGFAINVEEAQVVLTAEHGELASAILRNDVHGEHGIIREAAQVAAVAIRIVEFHHVAGKVAA